MKKNFVFIIWSCLITMSAPSFAESMSDLVFRDGLYYKKFTDVPFTGEIDDQLHKGSIKNGRKFGSWIVYFENGQLMNKGTFNINGKPDGLWVGYYDNGQLLKKGQLKDGKYEGYWETYYRDGTFMERMTGTFKNGEKISD